MMSHGSPLLIVFYACFVKHSINKFFATQKIDLYHRDSVPCREVARLIFTDFPTSLLVDGLGPVPRGEIIIVMSWIFSSNQRVLY